MGWLSGWSKRIHLTIDSSNIDDNLTDFPVMVHLNNTTASGVFDELGASYKKLAIYTDDHNHQCYIEVERWDDSNGFAWLWVKVPTVSSITDGGLYLYYDSSRPDNNTYVGLVTSSAAETVWDNNFVAVYHMGQDPSGGAGAIKDSTSNVYHGTPNGSMDSSDLVDGKVGKALDFDGTDDFIEIYSSGELVAQDTITVSAIVKNDNTSSRNLFVQNDNDNAYYTHQIRLNTGINYDNYLPSGGDISGPASFDTVNFHYISVVRSGSTVTTYYNGLPTITGTGDSRDSSADVDRTLIGAQYYSAAAQDPFDGVIEEVRISDYARPAAWIKAEYYSAFNNLISFGVEQTVISGSLGYGNRLKLTISPTNIDSNLYDFPILITLASGVGTNNYDATDVFTELGSDSNRKKIAITTDDGISECFTEIEKWDTGANKAYLWVKIPLVRSSSNTILYLYYDSANPDNNEFVGDIGSYAGQQVWSNGFEAVYHMGESSGGILDSTANSWNSGSPSGSQTRGVVAKVADGIEWDSDGSAGGTMSFSDNNITLETWVKHDSVPGSVQRWFTVASEIAVIRHEGSGTVKFYNKLSGVIRDITASSQVDTNWGYFAGTWDGGTQRVFKNGVEANSTGQTGTLDDATSFSFNSGSETFYGLQDETRVSIVSRSASWLKATYHTCEDNLISFADSPPPTITTYTGYVQLEGTPVSRKILLYNRATGSLIGVTTSNSTTGYFEIDTYLDALHFSVVLPEIADGFQPIIRDQLDPEV